MLHGYQAIILHHSTALYFHLHSIVFISNDLSNEDNCCQSEGIEELIKKKRFKRYFES